jgi:hypothetical protein
LTQCAWATVTGCEPSCKCPGLPCPGASGAWLDACQLQDNWTAAQGRTPIERTSLGKWRLKERRPGRAGRRRDRGLRGAKRRACGGFSARSRSRSHALPRFASDDARPRSGARAARARGRRGQFQAATRAPHDRRLPALPLTHSVSAASRRASTPRGNSQTAARPTLGHLVEQQLSLGRPPTSATGDACEFELFRLAATSVSPECTRAALVAHAPRRTVLPAT